MCHCRQTILTRVRRALGIRHYPRPDRNTLDLPQEFYAARFAALEQDEELIYHAAAEATAAITSETDRLGYRDQEAARLFRDVAHEAISVAIRLYLWRAAQARAAEGGGP